jgi:CobQ-like glutamine amidotransferase family enzyme
VSDSELTIVLLYPELLGLYGDRGNALALLHRARARDLPARLEPVEAGQPVPASGDVYLLGGGEDGAMLLAGELLAGQATLTRVLESGVTCLAVCAGFQLLSGEYVGPDGVVRPGLGVLDVQCGRLPDRRAIGEVVCEPAGQPWGMITGFENHLGDARLGPGATPLGRVVRGVGNGHDKVEGACAHGIVATYLHGPLLARNPDIADHLLARALGVDALAPLDEPEVTRLRTDRLRPRGLRALWPSG